MRALLTLGLVGIAIAAGTAGSLDSTFGDGGLVVTPGGRFFGVVVQADGKVVAAGVDMVTSAPVVARYNADGSLDTTFGTDGFVSPFDDDSIVDGWATSVALDASGRILVYGLAVFEIETGKGKKKKIERFGAFALARLDADGSLDTTFGDGGNAFVSEMAEDIGQPSMLALQADGKIIGSGTVVVRTRKKGGGL